MAPAGELSHEVATLILRCTSKALRLLGSDETVRRDLPPGVDDWYLNLLWLRGRKSLLLVHVGTLFPVLMWDVRVRELRPVGPYVVSQIEAALWDDKRDATTVLAYYIYLQAFKFFDLGYASTLAVLLAANEAGGARPSSSGPACSMPTAKFRPCRSV